MDNKIKNILNNSNITIESIISDQSLIETIKKVVNEITKAFKKDKKVLFCGNGGSAADAQHLAAEFSGRFYFDRDPLFAEALHVNTSYVTAVANDYSYDDIYSRLVKAKGRKGDVLIGLSTSGNSRNIINAIEIANKIGMTSIGFTGKNGGNMKNKCHYLINIPSDDTPRVQEGHILIGHIICELVEELMFSKSKKLK